MPHYFIFGDYGHDEPTAKPAGPARPLDLIHAADESAALFRFLDQGHQLEFTRGDLYAVEVPQLPDPGFLGLLRIGKQVRKDARPRP